MSLLVSIVGSVLTPSNNEQYLTYSPMKITWQPDVAAQSEIKYINIDLYDASDAVHFFVLKIADSLPVKTTSYTFNIPGSVKQGSTYCIRVWGPYLDKARVDYWQIPDSKTFSINPDPTKKSSLPVGNDGES